MNVHLHSIFLYIALAFSAIYFNPSMAADKSTDSEDLGAYERIIHPSKQEIENLQDFAKSNGFDLLAFFENTPEEDDSGAWSKFFALSMKLGIFDRRAELLGYYIHASFWYYISSCGLDKYAALINSQEPAVKQRIRDFIFYEAAGAPKEIRERMENDFRVNAAAIFPKEYIFGNDDKLFSTLR